MRLSPLSARSLGRFVEFFIGRSEQGEDLVMEGLKTEYHGQRAAGSVPDVQQVHAFETLEAPAHRWTIRRFLQLIGHRLARGRQLLAQPMIRQPAAPQT